MPPIVRLYKKSIVIDLFLMIILGTGGFVFRGELRNLLDFEKIAEQASLPKETAEKEIKKLVDFKNKKYGFYKDSTADETARFIKDYWKYKKVRVLPATIDAIKQELAAGRPVIIPAAGRLLGNPNFR